MHDRERRAYRFGFKAGVVAAQRRHEAQIAKRIRRLKQELSGMESLAVATDAQIALANAIEERVEGVVLH